ncbi:transposase [Candidatus Spongiihabitans sp.]|uniref:transposase n=1 Tax=Candidatus Spongiihabitans sp. TaxID=3101308 RepID=UPI003C7CA1AA
MARMARTVFEGVPHHITQRGNRRQQVFFCDEDYLTYLNLITTYCHLGKVEIWAYCLMPNHVHLVVVPNDKEQLAQSIGEAHRRYTRYINFRENWKGYLWQGRFSSNPMDEAYLYSTVRYVELNPVRAGLVDSAEKYRWSSARAHLTQENDGVVTVTPMLERIEDWVQYLSDDHGEARDKLIRLHSRTGRPLGSDCFVDKLEHLCGKSLRPGKPGPKAVAK